LSLVTNSAVPSLHRVISPVPDIQEILSYGRSDATCSGLIALRVSQSHIGRRVSQNMLGCFQTKLFSDFCRGGVSQLVWMPAVFALPLGDGLRVIRQINGDGEC
jgi:hypothetical protein